MKKRITISDKNKHLIKRIAMAVFGNILFAFAINVIITPLNLYSSGFTGIAMLLRMFFTDILKVPVIPGVDYLGIIYYTINIPLFILAYKALGKEFTVTTMLSIALTSIAMVFIPVPAKPLFDDLLTGCLVGGIVSGTAAGIVLKGGTSGGGQDIIGVAMSKTHPNFSVGRITIAINSVIYGICFFLFDIQIVVYSMIFAVANAIALDYQHTQNINVQVMIFTKKEGITDKVINELRRGLTYWKGAGGYTDEDTYVLMTMCSKYELPNLIEIVKNIDTQAFVMVNEGTKIYGNFEKRFTE
ncbi:MAG TPA: YitT family protein [Mogibacterium sp.]|nr:YitT family protein [Mogibacterium sp.]